MWLDPCTQVVLLLMTISRLRLKRNPKVNFLILSKSKSSSQMLNLKKCQRLYKEAFYPKKRETSSIQKTKRLLSNYFTWPSYMISNYVTVIWPQWLYNIYLISYSKAIPPHVQEKTICPPMIQSKVFKYNRTLN